MHAPTMRCTNQQWQYTGPWRWLAIAAQIHCYGDVCSCYAGTCLLQGYRTASEHLCMPPPNAVQQAEDAEGPTSKGYGMSC
jgi:hypothetical protein